MTILLIVKVIRVGVSNSHTSNNEIQSQTRLTLVGTGFECK